MNELLDTIKSIGESGWSLVTVVVAFSSAIVWTIKHINNKQARSDIENKEYTEDYVSFSESKFPLAKEQFEILCHELTSLFFKYSKELATEYKSVAGSPNEKQIFISRKSEEKKNESTSSFKRTFYDETKNLFNSVANSAMGYYKDFSIDEHIGDYLDGKENQNAKTYLSTIQDRARVCTSTIISRMQIDTWNHEIIDRCVSESISHKKVEDTLHAIYRNYHVKELAIQRRAEERKTKPLLKA